MGLLDRPYAGTWSPNQQKIVQWTPDALVYLNGDTGLAGCRTCHHRIDIQQFVTSISVDAGVDPGASSTSITLSIPKSYGDSIFRDGNTLLRNGLEVHVYFRGYFPMTGLADPDADPESQRVSGVKLSDIPQYPYYPAFHGVVTGVNHEYAGGYYSASLTCSGMLHFWQYMQIASNGSFFGARPNNSGVRTNLRGHVFTGMSPFSIIYSLYRDTAGSAAGVGFALQGRTNMQATSAASGDSLYSLTLEYWERRFMQGMYGLRMHGASGQLFSGSTQAYLARLGGTDARLISVVTGSTRPERDPLASSAAAFNLIDRDGAGRIQRGADLRYLDSSGGTGRDYGVVVPQMQAFVNDISQYGQVNLFETTYESKLDIATQVSNICGYEFYQDMDGDLVFKPPLYNLDTSSSRIYRLEPEDIINLSFTESEPEATYATVSGGPFQNMRGAVDEAEFGVRSTYYDYRLIAQFGWREGSLESNYYSNARSAFYAAVANLDRINQGMNSASVTIPLRPELRQGFPVYIAHIDCFYYVQSVSHAFTFGGACTTTLNLVARRRKFIPPGNPEGSSIGSIDLGRTSNPPRPLQYLDNSSVPRILGFPNVVMALDPERINPQFFLFGLDAEEGGVVSNRGRRGAIRIDPARLELLASNFAQVLVANSILGWSESGMLVDDEAPTPTSNTTPGTSAAVPSAEVTSAAPSGGNTVENVISGGGGQNGGWWIQTSSHHGVRITPTELRDGLRDLINLRAESRARITQINRETQTLNRRLQATREENAERSDIRTQIAALRSQADIINQFLAGTGETSVLVGTGVLQSVPDNDIRSLINFLVGEVRRRDPSSASRDMSVDETGALNNSATILELLNDRKASIGINTPGYYRYYSSAHPDPEQQGYTALNPDSGAPTPSSETAVADTADRQRQLRDLDFQISERTSPFQSGSRAGEDAFLVNLRSQRATLAATIASESSAAAETAEAAAQANRNTVGVIPLSMEAVEGLDVNLNEDQLQDFVSLVNRPAVNGLNVRTFASHDPTPTSTDQIFALSFEQRTARRFGSTLVFRIRSGSSTTDIANAFRACLTPNSGAGRLLGERLISVASGGPGGLSSAAETGGSLVARALAGISGLVGPGNASITSADIEGGTPNNRAVLNDIVVTDTALGSPDTEGRARTILMAKGNALIQQISIANQAQIERAIAIVSSNTPVSEGVSATPPPEPVVSTASATDAELAQRARIPPNVMRSIRAIESNGSPTAVRFERRLFRNRTGISIPGDGTDRSVVNSVLSQYPQHRNAAIESTSWGVYQVLGGRLLATHPNDPVGSFDRDPRGVSDDLLVAWFNANPRGRTAANAIGNPPTDAQIEELARRYNGRGTFEDGSLTNWGTRFRSAYLSGGTANPRRRSSSTSTQGGGLVFEGDVARSLSSALSAWRGDIGRLFGGRSWGGALPFSFDQRQGVIEEAISSFSPVFPVSDAVGYEHYGTYQYGRGLSIEPGGNYETLMGTDPFQYVDPALAYEFVSAVRVSGTGNAETGPALSANATRVLDAIATDPQFLNSPGADIAIREWREANPDADVSTRSTAMIAGGLANYIMSSRDAITHLPVSNVAFRLSDLTPFEENDVCACRGAEADLLLGAYMSGASASTFVSVDAPDQASQWVSQQMVLASDSWLLAQSAMRGVSTTEAGRQSVFDSVQGLLGVASQLTAPANQAENDLAGVGDPSSQNLRRLNEIAGRIDRTV